ncbi:hypothetical protein Y032_0436g1430 [Ancylostoma ceylanicum]|uniref:Uncharacterized protein n=1 Tax=Ancylostoma ceylanicum TaxID=53326 RepID=A0A016WZD3_9BILA|nr:hypothetical protein Y032_0436g1430 [Ancylostoma ceylanicum]
MDMKSTFCAIHHVHHVAARGRKDVMHHVHHVVRNVLKEIEEIPMQRIESTLIYQASLSTSAAGAQCKFEVTHGKRAGTRQIYPSSTGCQQF